MIGVISNIVVLKKYGFISGENGQEYFFHMSDTDDTWDEITDRFLKDGGGKIKVGFEPIKTPKGPRAKNVNMLDFD